MKDKVVFGRWEAVAVLINMLCTKIFLNFPRVTAENAATGGWIYTLYFSILAFLAFFIITKLYKRFEGKDLIDIGEHIGGSAGRIIVGTVIVIFFTYIVSVVLREFAEDLKVIALTVSPISFVTLFFIAGMVVGAYMGLEAIVRCHAVMVPVIAIGFLLIILGVSPYFDLSNLTPVLGSGVENIFFKGIAKLSMYGEFMLIFMMMPFIGVYKNFTRIGYAALGFSAFFLFLGSVALLLVIPYPVSIENFLPIYQLARLINLGRFFQRVESMFVLIWAAAALLYLTAGFYFIVYSLKKSFKLPFYRPLIFPIAIIIFTLSLLPPNLSTAVALETKYFRNYAWLISFVMVVILLAVARFIKRKKRKEVTGYNEI